MSDPGSMGRLAEGLSKAISGDGGTPNGVDRDDWGKSPASADGATQVGSIGVDVPDGDRDASGLLASLVAEGRYDEAALFTVSAIRCSETNDGPLSGEDYGMMADLLEVLGRPDLAEVYRRKAGQAL